MFCTVRLGASIHQTATDSEWHQREGRHAVYANARKEVPLPLYPTPVALKVREDDDRSLVPAWGAVGGRRETKPVARQQLLKDPLEQS